MEISLFGLKILNQTLLFSSHSTHIPSLLVPRHLHRTDQKRPDGLTLFSWAVVGQFLWDVTIFYTLVPNRKITGSVSNPGTAEAEDR